MKRFLLCCGAVLLAAVSLQARQQTTTTTPAPKLVLDVWDAVYLDGAKRGYQHTTVEKIERDGQTLYRTVKFMHMNLKRYQRVVTQRWAMSSEETADGKVVAVSTTQYLDGDRKVVQSGRVQGDKLIVRTPTDANGRAVPWKDGPIGMYAQELLFQKRKVKAGDRFKFLDYQLPFLSAVSQKVEIKDREERNVLAVHKDESDSRAVWEKKKLLRVEVQPQKVMVGGNAIALPRMIVWLDDKLRAVRAESDMPGMGRMTVCRTTRALAQKKGVAPALMTDLGLRTLVSLDRVILRPHEAKEIVYRITVKDDDDPTTTFARDDRQSVENVHGNTFDLRVRAVREPAQTAKDDKVKEEYLKSSYFLDSDNAKVRDLATRIVGEEKDPWRKGQRLEKWVHQHMKYDTEANFAPASQVLHDLQGDCRQNGMLTAALCRAAGVPARTDVGLVYANDREHGPILVFHMWTEVWIKGQWLMLDAVLGRGSVGAGHLKITDNSWKDIQTLAPLLPVTRVAGKVGVKVVGVR